MTHRPLWIVASLLCLGGLPAQDEEARFLETQAERLNACAKFALSQGFPRQAKLIYLEVIADYDKDDAVARKALGYLRVGTSWGPDPKFQFSDAESPNPKAAAKVKSRWKGTARTVGAAHRAMAQKYLEAGRSDRANYHFRRTLRFLPDDKAAMAALEFKPVASGLSGTALEQRLYERSKLMEKIVQRELGKQYPVAKLPDSERHPLLARSDVKYEGYKSENFVIWGNLEPEVLKNAAMFAERSYTFCKEVMREEDGFQRNTQLVNNYGFFKDKADYVAIVDANADAIPPERLEFTRKLFAAIINSGGHRLQFCGDGAGTGTARFYDAAVRWPVQHYAGCQAPGVREGIGHAVVGMFFDRNLLFTADMESKTGTVSGKRDKRYLMPDLGAWKELAVEAAWRQDSVPAAKLPLFHASDFPNPARIKAWSLADYLLRRDPTLVQKLDQSRRGRHENGVRQEFQGLAGGLTLATLEQEWRDFWTGATPTLKAINSNRPPMDAVSKDASRWLEALNEARTRIREQVRDKNGKPRYAAPPVAWSASMSARCRDHARYLQLNRQARGPEQEQRQELGSSGASSAGNLFAHMAIVSTRAKNPRKEIDRWMSWPGYRDVILDNRLGRVGLYADGNIMVMHTIGGNRQEPKSVPLMIYPIHAQKAVPTEVPVKELGWDLHKLLEKNGKVPQVIGFPISMHLALGHFPDSYRCQVTTAQGDVVEGIVHLGPNGSHRRDSGPAMVVFYPLAPLRRGTLHKVLWTWDRKRGDAKERAQQAGEFTTR